MKHLTYQQTFNKNVKQYRDKFKKMVKEDLEGDGWFLIVQNFPFRDGNNLMFTAGEDIGKWQNKNLVSLYGKDQYVIGRVRKKGAILTLIDIQEGEYLKKKTESGLREELKEFFKGSGVGVRVYKSVKAGEEVPEIEEIDLPEGEAPQELREKTEVAVLEMPALQPKAIQETLQQAKKMAETLAVHKTDLFLDHLKKFQKSVPHKVKMKNSLKSLNTFFEDVLKNRANLPDSNALEQGKEKLEEVEMEVRTNIEDAKEKFKTMKALAGMVNSKDFGKIEKSLRSTLFKWNSTIRGTLKKARNKGKELVNSSKDADFLKRHLMTMPANEVKDSLAMKIGGLRKKKYGENSNYRDLSANKKALVDAIYEGMMAAIAKPDGEMVVPVEALENIQKPGLTAEFKKDVTIDNQAFKVGEKCVYVEKEDGHYIYRVGPKKDNPSKTEVKKDKLFKLPSKNTITLKHRYKKSKEPLFDGMVSTADIKQGGIGDCYLIAGIYSITHKNPEFIHNMIKDNGNGTVTVRFYEKKLNAEGMEPVYVTVEKSVLESFDKAQDSLWVQMIEKAYATLKGSVEDIAHGGYTHDVYKTFMGIESSSENIKGGAARFSSIISMMPDVGLTETSFQKIKERKEEFGFTEEHLNAILEMSPEDLLNFDSTMNSPEYKEIFSELVKAEKWVKSLGKNPDPEEKRKAWEAYRIEKSRRQELQETLNDMLSVKDRKEAMRILVSQSKTIKETEKDNILYREDFDKIMKELRSYAIENPSLENDGKTYKTIELVEYLESEGKFKDFPNMDVMEHSGNTIHYQPKHEEAFKQVSDALKAGKYIAAGTTEDIGISQGLGKSAGESKVDGLAGQHAYAIMDTVVMHGRKFIKVANPWGSNYSRDYDIVGGKIKSKQMDMSDYAYLPDPEKRTGTGIAFNESWIELREFVGVFDNLYITNR